MIRLNLLTVNVLIGLTSHTGRMPDKFIGLKSDFSLTYPEKIRSMTSQQSTFIQSDPATIFAYLMDVKNRKAYIPALEEVILLDPLPIQKGSRYIEVANIAGRRLKTTYQVIEFEQNKHTAAQTLESIFPIRADLDLVEKKGGTELVIQLNFTLKGIFKLGASFVKGIVDQQAKGILEKIKANIESFD